MKDLLKKPDDEMLVVHAPHPQADRVARVPVVPGMDALPPDIDRLAERLRRSKVSGRAHLIAAINSRFGNAFASRVVAASERGRRGGTSEPGNS
jgi:hypothetical protein